LLARANRVITPEDFRVVVRRGRRSSSPLAIYYRLETQAGSPARFGFIVSRSVGGAVERNLVRRRMRAVARQLVDAGARSADVVVRALPASAQSDWATLSADMHAALDPQLIPR